MNEERPIQSPDIDVRDPLQAAAFESLGHYIVSLLDRFEVRGDPGRVTLPERMAYWYVSESIQLLADAHLLLRPGEQAFAHARAVSGILRSLADVYARQLAVWVGTDPEMTVREMLADSIDKELKAAESAALAGSDADALRSFLREVEAGVGTAPKAHASTASLLSQNENEVLCVFRWESSQVHLGAAALSGGGRSVTLSSGQQIDVMLWPTSLWRVAQLTWACYGIATRLLTLIDRNVGLPTLELAMLDATNRETIHATATRPRPDGEPPSPSYGDFPFQPWS